jgi:Spy/CpxP family protein refolding chaperone
MTGVVVLAQASGSGLQSDVATSPHSSVQESRGQDASGLPSGQRPCGPAQATPGSRPDYKFWNDSGVRKQIGLSDQQVSRIEKIYDQRVVETASFVADLEKQRTELDKMTQERTANASTYRLQVSRVDSIVSELHQSRTLMLYKILLVLTPEQHKKLQAIVERNGRGRDGAWHDRLLEAPPV